MTHVLFPSLLLRLGPSLCIVANNGFRLKAIQYIERKFSLSLDLGSTEEAKVDILRKLNNSYQHHLQKFRSNVSVCVERLFLEASNPKDPQLAWVLVGLQFVPFFVKHVVKSAASPLQEGFGVGPGASLMPNDHPTWSALGIAPGTLVRLVQSTRTSPASVVADLSNPVAKTFVQDLLGM